jgi:deferrochelatase/peroxidase EfeB
MELSPDHQDPAIVHDPSRITDFTYGNDKEGTRCPLGAHIRRANPRDAFGFSGRLVNRRRITRRSMPYGEFVSEGDSVIDADERGMCFIALNASISRQFEFVNRQWIGNGNDAGQGSDKDLLVGNHEAGDSFVVQGDMTKTNPPYLFDNIPSFVELRGGDYFFIPSITALRMIATETVTPY